MTERKGHFGEKIFEMALFVYPNLILQANGNFTGQKQNQRNDRH
jgi:hypothetical protein